MPEKRDEDFWLPNQTAFATPTLLGINGEEPQYDGFFLIWCSGLIIAGTTGIAAALRKICKKPKRKKAKQGPQCNKQCQCCQRLEDMSRRDSSSYSKELVEMNKERPGFWWSSFYCPISGELMMEPVASKYGHLYERSCIEEWIRRRTNCPFTGKYLHRDDLYPVYALKVDIAEFRRRKLVWDSN